MGDKGKRVGHGQRQLEDGIRPDFRSIGNCRDECGQAIARWPYQPGRTHDQHPDPVQIHADKRMPEREDGPGGHAPMVWYHADEHENRDEKDTDDGQALDPGCAARPIREGIGWIESPLPPDECLNPAGPAGRDEQKGRCDGGQKVDDWTLAVGDDARGKMIKALESPGIFFLAGQS